jgi:hypothetical protein
MVQEADMTHEALHVVTQEKRRLREYISVARAMLDVANEEACEAKATAAVTQAKLTGKSRFHLARDFPDLDGDGFESFLFSSPGAREQLAVAQAEMAELRRVSDDLARQLAEAARK